MDPVATTEDRVLCRNIFYGETLSRTVPTSKYKQVII